MNIEELINPVREPDFYIGGKENPYMKRWYLHPRNDEGNVYLNHILRDDEDRALHDHPWPFSSFLLAGGYREHFIDGTFIERRVAKFAAPMPDFIFREATHAHRIELFKNIDGTSIPAWTLVLTGPKIRDWGFHCKNGWIPWQEFCDPVDTGNIGKGCPE